MAYLRKIVGVFQAEADAGNAIRELKRHGYADSEISIASKHKSHVQAVTDVIDTKAPEGLAAGAATGGVIGGVTALLAGIGLLAVPGIGPLLAAGPIAAVITGAALGAGAGGLVGGLVGMGVPEEEALRIGSHVDEGRIIVVVEAKASQEQDVYDTFRNNHSLHESSTGTLRNTMD